MAADLDTGIADCRHPRRGPGTTPAAARPVVGMMRPAAPQWSSGRPAPMGIGCPEMTTARGADEARRTYRVLFLKHLVNSNGAPFTPCQGIVTVRTAQGIDHVIELAKRRFALDVRGGDWRLWADELEVQLLQPEGPSSSPPGRRQRTARPRPGSRPASKGRT